MLCQAPSGAIQVAATAWCSTRKKGDMASAMYGVVIGIGSVVFTRLMPQPMGSIIYWGFFSVQLSCGAVTCWRRTGLAFASAAMVNGAVMSICLVVLAAMGHLFPDLGPASWV